MLRVASEWALFMKHCQKKLAKLLFDWIAGIGMQYSAEQKEGAVVI